MSHNSVQYLPANHIGTLVDVGDTEEEALDTGEALTEVGLWIVTVVEIFSHYII